MSVTPDASTIAVGLKGRAYVLRYDGASYNQVGNELVISNVYNPAVLTRKT